MTPLEATPDRRGSSRMCLVLGSLATYFHQYKKLWELSSVTGSGNRDLQTVAASRHRNSWRRAAALLPPARKTTSVRTMGQILSVRDLEPRP